MIDLPKKLRELRLDAGLSQDELATRLGSGYSQGTVGAIEAGKRTAGQRIVKKWADACGYEHTDVFTKKSRD